MPAFWSACTLIEGSGNGASLVYVRDQMGHSTIRITADIYGHLLPSANAHVVDRLDAPTTSPESATQTQPRPRCRARRWRLVAEKSGGPGGIRTLDLMTASHARSQLRHRPKIKVTNRFALRNSFLACANCNVNECAAGPAIPQPRLEKCEDGLSGPVGDGLADSHWLFQQFGAGKFIGEGGQNEKPAQLAACGAKTQPVTRRSSGIGERGAIRGMSLPRSSYRYTVRRSRVVPSSAVFGPAGFPVSN
jgi:hypothetical protein